MGEWNVEKRIRQKYNDKAGYTKQDPLLLLV